MSEFSFPKYNGYSVQFDELVAEGTIVMREETYHGLILSNVSHIVKDDYISATREHAEQPIRFGEPNEVIQAMDAADSPATEIHEDDELSINNAEPESVDKHEG